MSPAMKPSPKQEDLVKRYFSLIRDLRNGKEGSVERLVDLWDADGVFEFAGAPPVQAKFVGRQAINVLYKNRFDANGMELQLAGAGTKSQRSAALGVVDTDVHKQRVIDDKLVAGWTTVIGTKDGRGFEVSGSHTFTFADGKIRSLKIVISPKADTAKMQTLSMEGLAVEDIGRLALAAWAVV